MNCVSGRRWLLLPVFLFSVSGCGTLELDAGAKQRSLNSAIHHDGGIAPAIKTDGTTLLAKSEEAGKTISIKGTGRLSGSRPQVNQKKTAHQGRRA